MNKCEKCGFLHYRTDPCRRPKPPASLLSEDDMREEMKSDDNAEIYHEKGLAWPSGERLSQKRSGNRHRPGYFTEYMRDYRKGILRRPKPTTKREKSDEQ